LRAVEPPGRSASSEGEFLLVFSGFAAGGYQGSQLLDLFDDGLVLGFEFVVKELLRFVCLTGAFMTFHHGGGVMTVALLHGVLVVGQALLVGDHGFTMTGQVLLVVTQVLHDPGEALAGLSVLLGPAVEVFEPMDVLGVPVLVLGVHLSMIGF